MKKIGLFLFADSSKGDCQIMYMHIFFASLRGNILIYVGKSEQRKWLLHNKYKRCIFDAYSDKKWFMNKNHIFYPLKISAREGKNIKCICIWKNMENIDFVALNIIKYIFCTINPSVLFTISAKYPKIFHPLIIVLIRGMKVFHISFGWIDILYNSFCP